MTKLTNLELKVIIEHLNCDLNYGASGTFNKPPKDGNPDYDFDKKSAQIAKNALVKLVNMIKK